MQAPSSSVPRPPELVALARPVPVRRTLLPRTPLALAGLVAALVALTALVVRSSVGVYLPPDAAHYLADADAIYGGGVRELRHPPLFPALLGLVRLPVGDLAGFAVAMALSLAVLIVALYVLLRAWLGKGASLAGAAVAAFFPTTAELLGWGGGATLLAIGCLVLALAAMERWMERQGWRQALLVGGALALTALSHPFVFPVAIACVAVRWALVLWQEARLTLRFEPFGVAGILLAGAPLVPAFLLAAPYYLGVERGTHLGLHLPQLGDLSALLAWALEGHPLPLALVAAGVLAPLAFPHPGPATYALCLTAVGLTFSTTLETEASYLSRIAYLTPVLAALGAGTAVALAGPVAVRAVRRFPRPRALTLGAPVLLVALLALSSYAPRLERAAHFYQLLGPDDVQALEGLARRKGAVATSWHGASYGSGVSTSWFVEGIPRRRAYGPTAPWLANVREQREAGLDMQRFFAGTEGIENGVIQLAAGAPGMRADPSVQVWSDGFYFPLLFANALVNAQPAALGDKAERFVGSHHVTWLFEDDSGRPVLAETARLEGRTATVRYELGTLAQAGAWSIWLWPPYGIRWTGVQESGGAVEGRHGLPREEIRFRVAAEGAEVVYHPVDARFGVEALEVRAGDARALTVSIEVDSRALPGRVSAFDERLLLRRYGISDVVVWKDIGWRDRFDRSPCYLRPRESSRLLIYAVRDVCARAASKRLGGR